MGIKSWVSVDDVSGLFVQFWSQAKGLVVHKSVVPKKHLYPVPYRPSKHGTYQRVADADDSDPEVSIDEGHHDSYTSSGSDDDGSDYYVTDEEQDSSADHLDWLDLSSEGWCLEMTDCLISMIFVIEPLTD